MEIPLVSYSPLQSHVHQVLKELTVAHVSQDRAFDSALSNSLCFFMGVGTFVFEGIEGQTNQMLAITCEENVR